MRLVVPICLFAALMASAQSKPDPAQGNEIFDEQCSSCHRADSFEKKVGPGLKFLFSKEKLDSNGKPVNNATVLEKINIGGKGMPAFKDSLREQDKQNLLAYLNTI
jgi:cytochrome c